MTTQDVQTVVAQVRALAESTPNPCEGSRGHMRDDFAWQAEDDLRRLTAGEPMEFTLADLQDDCVTTLVRWRAEDAS